MPNMFIRTVLPGTSSNLRVYPRNVWLAMELTAVKAMSTPKCKIVKHVDTIQKRKGAHHTARDKPPVEVAPLIP